MMTAKDAISVTNGEPLPKWNAVELSSKNDTIIPIEPPIYVTKKNVASWYIPDSETNTSVNNNAIKPTGVWKDSISSRQPSSSSGTADEAALRSTAPRQKKASHPFSHSTVTQSHERTLRRLEDLKISNESLVQVNNSLEQTIKEQAILIQRLQRRIEKLTSSSPHSEIQELDDKEEDEIELDAQECLSNDSGHQTDMPSDCATMVDLEMDSLSLKRERFADQDFDRICAKIEKLLYSAKQATSTKPIPGQ